MIGDVTASRFAVREIDGSGNSSSWEERERSTISFAVLEIKHCVGLTRRIKLKLFAFHFVMLVLLQEHKSAIIGSPLCDAVELSLNRGHLETGLRKMWQFGGIDPFDPFEQGVVGGSWTYLLE